MYKIMSNHCTYPEIQYEALEPTILVEEDVIWENQDGDHTEEQEAINYADNTLADTADESYVTAAGDNTTQYFSVLDSSSQTILNDISDITINNSIIHGADGEQEPNEENHSIDVNNGQVVLFKVDGSEELYGFQLTRDEEGNLQKYQFKVRQNIEGNLEAIPETLQVLPVDNILDEEAADETDQTNDDTFQDAEAFDNIVKDHSVIIKEEQNIATEEHSAPEFEEEEIFEEQLDTKEGILELSTTTAAQKQEIHDEETEDINSQQYNENAHSVVDDDEHAEVFYTHSDAIVDDDFSYNNTAEEDPIDDQESPTPAEHYEELFVKESHLMDDANGMTEENGLDEGENLNESDNEEYETVEGVHVTGDTEENVYENTDIRKSPSYQASTIASRKKIIKNVIRKVRIQKNDGKANLYYVVKNTEKENMGQIRGNSITIRPNPRSILKCSLATMEPQKYEEEEEKYDKRFAKSKEAQQARLFHNFIAQTKIIHAPARQERLPRKQQIKPMKRTDEEIVVQEVVVSSNGFIETSEEGVLKERVPLKPTEYIQLSDSDEDFDPKAPHKRKKKTKKRKPMVEITISDSEEESSDKSIKEDDDDTETAIAPVKRPRGRPPKNHDRDEEKEIVKRPRGRPPKNPKPPADIPEEEIIVIKIDNKCPKCPKSFPSEGSLRSHMQYHNFSQSKSNDAKYICEKCGDTFKNSFLLNRHMNSHKTNNITCGICKKIFNDQAQLITHKKTHIKQRMFKTTTLLKNSPKIARTQNSKNKCEDCGKTFSNIVALNIHKKQHKKFVCQTCKMSFNSRVTLGSHLQRDCVKKRLKSPKKKSALKADKQPTLIQTTTSQSKKEETTISKPVLSNATVVTNIKCDSCSMTFVTYTSLFEHKVRKHGLDSPDTSIIQGPVRKSLYKQKIAHSGVRPSTGLKNACTALQSKLEAFKNSHKKT